MPQRLCLATVTTDSYLPGTLVTLHSFLAANRWFDGDIAIIAEGLSEESRRKLALVAPRITYVAPGPELLERVEEVAREVPAFARHTARFLSLEAFRLTGYDRVLLCDSDLLFRGSVEALFARPEPFIACGDGHLYKGERRPWLPADAPPVSFNSGLVLADGSCLGGEHYRALVDFVSARNYRQPHMKLADQIVLNVHFAARATIAGPRYNYLLAHEEPIRAAEGMEMEEALVLHFNGREKPWHIDASRQGVRRSESFARACALWFEAYAACKAAMSQRAAAR